MAGPRHSVQLFGLGQSIAGTPTPIPPASFQTLDAKEVQDIERWLKANPALLGEDLLIVASQLTGFDKTKDRPDLLALDRSGKLVVIEIKRDDSGSGQDLQALRYAAYVSTLEAEQLVGLYRAYVAGEQQRELTPAEARKEIDDFITDGDVETLDEDEQPRLVLVAAHFQVGVTNTALWLTRNFEIDITCVQLVPHVVQGEIVLAATVLIPLPEAADFEVRLQEKRRKANRKRDVTKLDLEAAREFIASVPDGRWTSYGDVAVAAGNPAAPQPIGTWLSNKGDDVVNVHRVLNRHGEVSPGWKAVTPGVPPTPEAVQAKLISEGVEFTENRASQDQRWTVEDWTASLEEPATGSATDPHTG
jgi:alkylated DNA nucleotide flippase Atl1